MSQSPNMRLCMLHMRHTRNEQLKLSTLELFPDKTIQGLMGILMDLSALFVPSGFGFKYQIDHDETNEHVVLDIMKEIRCCGWSLLSSHGLKNAGNSDTVVETNFYFEIDALKFYGNLNYARNNVPNHSSSRIGLARDLVEEDRGGSSKSRKRPTNSAIEMSSDDEGMLSAARQPILTTRNTSNTGSSNNNNNNKPLTLLSDLDRMSFYNWLEQYRKKWPTYWNYFGNASINEISYKVPLTIEELANISGVGDTKASMYGEEMLATIYAFLEKNNLLWLYPNAVPPSIPANPVWNDVFSDDAAEVRAMEISFAEKSRAMEIRNAKKRTATAHAAARTQVVQSSSSGSNNNNQLVTLLSDLDRISFYNWLEQYRKKWPTYWNYFGNASINEISYKVPLTIEELANISGVGDTKASMYGEEMLATIYAFLEKNNLLWLYPNAVPPSIPANPIWNDVFSDDAAEVRAMEISFAEKSRANAYTNAAVRTQAAPSSSSSSSSSKAPSIPSAEVYRQYASTTVVTPAVFPNSPVVPSSPGTQSSQEDAQQPSKCSRIFL